jgi:hypothetical protein
MTFGEMSYAAALDYAAVGVFLIDKRPELRAPVYAAIIRALALRGALIGGRLPAEVGREVLSDIVTRGARFFATELSRRSTLPDDTIAQIEQGLSDTVANALETIREHFA